MYTYSVGTSLVPVSFVFDVLYQDLETELHSCFDQSHHCSQKPRHTLPVSCYWRACIINIPIQVTTAALHNTIVHTALIGDLGSCGILLLMHQLCYTVTKSWKVGARRLGISSQLGTESLAFMCLRRVSFWILRRMDCKRSVPCIAFVPIRPVDQEA